MELIERVRAWTYRRQGLGRVEGDLLRALRSVVAVYSSHPSAPLSLLCRCQPFEAEAFRQLEEQRKAIRIPAMRQSIFLVPTETAATIFAATRLPMEKHAGRLRYAGLEESEYERLKARVLEQTQEPIGASALQQSLKGDGSAGGDVRIMTAVRIMASEGLVLRLGSSLRTDSLRYVATASWLGHPLEERDPELSLQWLAERYFGAFGPARAADFAWWVGIPRRRAQTALQGFNLVDVGGGFLLPADELEAFERVEPLDPAAIDLLPKWDAYTMGYPSDGRQRLVDDRHLKLAYTAPGTGGTSGDGLPLVLRGGRAIATWSHKFEGNRMVVKVTPFEAGADPLILDKGAFDEVGRMLGASRCTGEWEIPDQDQPAW